MSQTAFTASLVSKSEHVHVTQPLADEMHHVTDCRWAVDGPSFWGIKSPWNHTSQKTSYLSAPCRGAFQVASVHKATRMGRRGSHNRSCQAACTPHEVCISSRCQSPGNVDAHFFAMPLRSTSSSPRTYGCSVNAAGLPGGLAFEIDCCHLPCRSWQLQTCWSTTASFGCMSCTMIKSQMLCDAPSADHHSCKHSPVWFWLVLLMHRLCLDAILILCQ